MHDERCGRSAGWWYFVGDWGLHVVDGMCVCCKSMGIL